MESSYPHMKIRLLLVIIMIFSNSIFANEKPQLDKINYQTKYDTTELRRAVGQMMMIKFIGSTIDDNSNIVEYIKQYHIGGVLLDNYRYKNAKDKTANIENPKQLKILINKLQFYAKKYNNYPLLIAVNQEGGFINSLKPSHGFNNPNDPSQFQLGKKNQELIFNETLKRAMLLKEVGINVNLAPVADLNINPGNPAVGKLERSFGNNPQQVTSDLKSAIRAYKKANILCTLKHFPGLGSANKNTDYDLADLTKTWDKSELIPYQNLIESGPAYNCDLIMSSHLINKKLDPSGIPVSLSKKVITDLLIKQMHFQGLVITDDMDAAAIRNHFSTRVAIEKAVLAGNNIIIYGGTQGYDPEQEVGMLFNTLFALAKNDAEVRLNVFTSYAKIQKVKQSI